MPLDNASKKRLRALGHKLKPVVIVAQTGVTANVRSELERALKDHELIKIRVLVPARDVKRELIAGLCAELGAECVQSIGHTALLYRRAEKANPKLSNLLRELD